MSAGTKIQWADDTHNFWQGCTKISPGCQFCYAEARDQRFNEGKHWGPGAPRVRSKDFDAPLRWNQKPWICDFCGMPSAANRRDNGSCLNSACDYHKGATGSFHRRRVFSLSLGDWLDEEVPIEWLADMLDVIRRCPNLDFLLLTKRPENWTQRIQEARNFLTKGGSAETAIWLNDWLPTPSTSGVYERGRQATTSNPAMHGEPPANVFPGATCENQEMADKRIPELLKIPAVCRFVSQEPGLSEVNYGPWFCEETPKSFQFLSRYYKGNEFDATGSQPEITLRLKKNPGIHWIIVGGESGPHARPFDLEWARQTVAQCKAAGVACFVKQMGAKPYQSPQRDGSTGYEISLRDKKGGEMAEWPADLRVREFPPPRRDAESD